MIINELGMRDAKPVTTPGEVENKAEEEENAQELCEREASKFRALAARSNYLAADRPDIMYATKEICRWMAKPTQGAMKKMRRVGRYLTGSPRTISKYESQR